MKGLNGIIIGALVVVLVIWGVLAYQKNNNNTDNTLTSNNNSNGSLSIGVTDATADIKNVSDIDMTVKKVEVHSQEKGWVTVASNSKSYKLLALHANEETQLYAKKDNFDAGTYDRIRVTLGDTVINTKNNGQVKAVLPSSQVVMNSMIRVANNQTAHVTLDFLADKSLHSTSDNKYVFAPVVRSEARSNATVATTTGDAITVTGGTIDSSGTVGVDLGGISKSNFELQTTKDFKIQSDNGGVLTFMLGGKTFTSDTSVNQESQDGNTSTNTNSSVNGSTDTSTNGSNTNANTNTNSNTNSSSGSLNTNGGINVNLGY